MMMMLEMILVTLLFLFSVFCTTNYFFGFNKVRVLQSIQSVQLLVETDPSLIFLTPLCAFCLSSFCLLTSFKKKKKKKCQKKNKKKKNSAPPHHSITQLMCPTRQRTDFFQNLLTEVFFFNYYFNLC